MAAVTKSPDILSWLTQQAAQVRAFKRYQRYLRREAKHARFHRIGLNGARAVARRLYQLNKPPGRKARRMLDDALAASLVVAV